MEETAEMMESFWQAVKRGDMGTESLGVFMKRNCDLCDVITEKHKDKNVLIVTHAANARIIDYYFKGKPKAYDFSNRVIEKGELVTFANR